MLVKIGTAIAGSEFASLVCSFSAYTNFIKEFIPNTTTAYLTFAFSSDTGLRDIDDVYIYPISSVSDSGSNPISGASINIVPQQTGKIDKCIQFTGTSYVSVPSAGTINKYATFMAWVNKNTTTAYNYIATLDSPVFAFGIHADSSSYLGTIQGGIWNTQTTLTPAKDSFNHICYVCNDSTTSVYLNGNFSSSLSGLAPITVTAGIHIGSNHIGTGNLSGYIEDVRLYDRVLTEQEISAIYERGRGTYSQSLIKGYPTVKPPIHHYRLNELTGTTVNDAGSVPMNGTIGAATINQTVTSYNQQGGITAGN
jgi:hypothetical protein